MFYDTVKLQAKHINKVIANTSWETAPFKQGQQGVQMALVGYYTPSGANWSYQAGVAVKDGELFTVIKQFGGVVGIIPMYAGENK